jgi:hypothetical protein
MFSWPGPDAPISMQSERTGIENRWFALTGRVVELKVEEEGDLHIALDDATGDKPGVVVCEIPAQPEWCEIRTTVFSWTHTRFPFRTGTAEEADLRSISCHYGDRQGVLGCRPCAERPSEPSQIHAALCCVRDSSGDEADGSVILAQNQIASLPYFPAHCLCGGRNRRQIAV